MKLKSSKTKAERRKYRFDHLIKRLIGRPWMKTKRLWVVPGDDEKQWGLFEKKVLNWWNIHINKHGHRLEQYESKDRKIRIQCLFEGKLEWIELDFSRKT